MRIGIENEASCMMATGGETERLLRSAADPRLTVVWDPCNVLYVPGFAGTATQGFAQIAARVGHIHIKDAVRTPQGAEARKLGEGDVGWKEHLDRPQWIRRTSVTGDALANEGAGRGCAPSAGRLWFLGGRRGGQ